MDLKAALAIASSEDASPALRALSLQLRAVEARSIAARKSAEAAKASLDTAVREGMATSAEAKALVAAMGAVEASERQQRQDIEDARLDARAAAEALDAAHEALGVDVAARTAHEGTC